MSPGCPSPHVSLPDVPLWAAVCRAWPGCRSWSRVWRRCGSPPIAGSSAGGRWRPGQSAVAAAPPASDWWPTSSPTTTAPGGVTFYTQHRVSDVITGWGSIQSDSTWSIGDVIYNTARRPHQLVTLYIRSEWRHIQKCYETHIVLLPTYFHKSIFYLQKFRLIQSNQLNQSLVNN